MAFKDSCNPIWESYIPIIPYLCFNRFQPVQETIYPIHVAAELGDVKLLRLLLAAGADAQQRRQRFKRYQGIRGHPLGDRSAIRYKFILI